MYNLKHSMLEERESRLKQGLTFCSGWSGTHYIVQASLLSAERPA